MKMNLCCIYLNRSHHEKIDIFLSVPKQSRRRKLISTHRLADCWIVRARNDRISVDTQSTKEINVSVEVMRELIAQSTCHHYSRSYGPACIHPGDALSIGYDELNWFTSIKFRPNQMRIIILQKRYKTFLFLTKAQSFVINYLSQRRIEC